MIPNTKACFFVAIFSTCLILNLLLPFLHPGTSSLHDFDIFKSPSANYLLLILVFMVIAFVLSNILHYACQQLKKTLSHAPKIGNALVSQGLITPEQLKEALLEQGLRLGEVLTRAGRITNQQKEHALQFQKRQYREFGEILKELGYATGKDIQWAMDKMNRKVGSILKEKRLVTDYDITCALSLKDYQIDTDGKIITRK